MREVSGYVVREPERTSVPVVGGGFFPVRRIYCIGRNYADHVRELGGDPKKDLPVIFTKPADAIVPNGSRIAYPLATQNLHFEGELVVAICSDGARVSAEGAAALIFGYGLGCDLTRRDLQNEAKAAGAPWDAAKAFDQSAPMAAITPAGDIDLDGARLSLSVNGETRQDAPLSAMIWSVPELIAAVSERFSLKAGDLIFTGTPEGVGPLAVGDAVEVRAGALEPLRFEIGEPQ